MPGFDTFSPVLLGWTILVLALAALIHGALGLGFPTVATPLLVLVTDLRSAVTWGLERDNADDEGLSLRILTALTNESVLMRSSAFRSWPKNAAGSSDDVPLVASYSERNTSVGFSQSTVLACWSRSSMRAVIVMT